MSKSYNLFENEKAAAYGDRFGAPIARVIR